MPVRDRISRREALGKAASTIGALTTSGFAGIATRQAFGNAVGANDRIRVGVIGTGVRGKYLIGNLPESARVTALCDCATSNIGSTIQPTGDFTKVLGRFAETVGPHCATYQDYRVMLDRENLDAVIIATPDHHHAAAGLRALQAGLDVYLEKPLTVTIREGRLLADAVRKTGRVLQVGSQQRTMDMNRFACEFIRDGGLGKISRVDLPNYPGPIQTARFPEEPVPAGFDWELFVGPTPMRRYHRRWWLKDDFKVGSLLWRGWDLFRDFSGHIMTNWGAHSVDMMQYALGRDDSGPVRVVATRPESVTMIQQDWKQKTPQAESNERRFWPVRMWYSDGVEVRFSGSNSPITFHGELGTMKVSRNQFSVDPPELITSGPGPEIAARWEGDGHVARPHLQNWLECIRTRDIPNAPVEVGHRTVTICHLANIARELNRELHWDPALEQCVHDDAANQLTDRPRRRGFELPDV